MGLADQIFSQMNKIGEPLTSTSSTVTTPGQQPFDLGSIGMMLAMLMMNQEKPIPAPPQIPIGIGQGFPDAGLMGMGGMGTPTAATGAGGIAGSIFPLIMSLMGATPMG